MPALTLQIFISSPGDVGQERLLAIRVVERLQGEFGGRVALQPILWEHEPLRATGHFQEQITRPSEADVVICILWSRLGTRLPEEFRRPDGSRYASGTEWEFEDAVRSYQEHGKPDLLVYRKTAEPLASLADPKSVLRRLEQMQALDAFIDRWFGNAEVSFKRAFHPFRTADQFEHLLATHLRRLIRGRLPKHLTTSAAPSPGECVGAPPGLLPVIWPPDRSPYRGLQVFDQEHAPVFFGRTRAIGDIKDALTRQAASGRAFLIIYGMSGCGKSSLVRAGVLPTLTQPGVIEGVGFWRWATFRPIGAVGDLCDGLALSLLGPDAVPEWEAGGLDARELAALFREAPQRAVGPLRAGLKRAAEAVAAREAEPIGRPPGPLPGLAQPASGRLILMIDQMEELFTREDVDARQREGFVAVLSALARSGLVWVIATMRSDFYPRCAEIRELAALKEGGGQYDLLPPTVNELRQMICQPAYAAGLRFEIDPRTGEPLDDRLHAAAARDPEALPLLEFALDELFKLRTNERILTLAAYEQLGGLEGALARRAEEALSALEPSVQATLPFLLGALVTVGDREGSLVAGRRVPLARLQSPPTCATLTQALIGARLLVADRADDGQATVGVAHEALLHRWPRVQKWLADNRELLQTRERVADAAAAWRNEGKQPDFLLRPGKPLAEAEDLLKRSARLVARGSWLVGKGLTSSHHGPRATSHEPRAAIDLDADLVEYIEASLRKARRALIGRYVSLGALVLGLAGFGAFSYRQWQTTAQLKNAIVLAMINFTNDIPRQLKPFPEDQQRPILELSYRTTLDLLRQIPYSLSNERTKAVNLHSLARIALQQGRDEMAAHECQAALEIGSRLAQQTGHPGDRRNLAVYYDTLGDIQRDLGRNNEALAAYSQSLAMSQALALEDGHDAEKAGLCFRWMKLGDLQLDLGHSREALAAYREALQLATHLPSIATPARSYDYLPACYERIGSAQRKLGHVREAMASYGQSFRLWQDRVRRTQDQRDQHNLDVVAGEIDRLKQHLGGKRQSPTCGEQRSRSSETNGETAP